jgi:hypothetical protein
MNIFDQDMANRLNEIERLNERTAKLEAALKPLASLGVARVETDIALLDYNLPYCDRPDDLVLYNDNMGHSIAVGDVRKAKAALRNPEQHT